MICLKRCLLNLKNLTLQLWSSIVVLTFCSLSTLQTPLCTLDISLEFESFVMNGFNCYSSFIFALRKKYKRRGVDVGSTLHVSNLIQPWIYLQPWPGILKHFKTNTGIGQICGQISYSQKKSRSAETLNGLQGFQKVRKIRKLKASWDTCVRRSWPPAEKN